MAVRLRDIADELNLSTMTISKVLRGQTDVSAETSARVLKRVRELNYRPNVSARGLRTGQTHSIGIVVPSLFGNEAPQISHGAQETLRALKYSLVLSSADGDAEAEEREVELHLARQVDALLFCMREDASDIPGALKAASTPFLLLGHRPERVAAPSIGVDEEEVGYVAAGHLLARRCKRIAYLRGSRTPVADIRFAGFLKAAREAGVSVRQDWVVEIAAGDHAYQDAWSAAQKILGGRPRPDGVVCHTDMMAMAVRDVALASSISVPEQLQVIGTGNQSQLCKTGLTLSSVDTQPGEIGRRAAKLALRLGPVKAPAALEAAKALDLTYKVTVPADEPYTEPYFKRDGLQNAFYEVDAKAPKSVPLSPYPLQAEAELTYQGTTVSLAGVVQVVSRVNGPGLLRYPMPVGPKFSVALSPAAGVIPLESHETSVSVRVHNNMPGAATPTVKLALPAGWKSEPASIPVSFTQTGEEQTVSFRVTPKAEPGRQYTVTAVAELDGKDYSEGYVQIGYQGLRPYFLYSPAKYTATGTDVKVAPGLNVGYIEGSGDDVPAALEQMNVHVTYLSAQDLAGGDLGKYDTIVLGVRAYAVRPDLIANNARLLQYVEKGGTVIVQYNTPEYDHNYGPYPYVMSGDPEEVTDEKSVVKILEPGNPVFNWPNKITTADFDGWIEERGSKFLQSWDPKYSALVETHDAGQPEQKGGLVYARYGKGVYVYNAYAFYRQLPLGVPGAFRLFANMLSLPKNPQVQQ